MTKNNFFWFVFICLKHDAPSYLSSKFVYTSSVHSQNTHSQSSNTLVMPSFNIKPGKHTFTFRGSSIDPLRIRRATSVPLGKGKKFALHHRKMSTTKRPAIQILHISTFQFTFKCEYNNFISKYTDINSLHVTQINLLHNNTCCST